MFHGDVEKCTAYRWKADGIVFPTICNDIPICVIGWSAMFDRGYYLYYSMKRKSRMSRSLGEIHALCFGRNLLNRAKLKRCVIFATLTLTFSLPSFVIWSSFAKNTKKIMKVINAWKHDIFGVEGVNFWISWQVGVAQSGEVRWAAVSFCKWIFKIIFQAQKQIVSLCRSLRLFFKLKNKLFCAEV